MAEPRSSVRANRLRCPVCCELLRNPTTLPCGHSFCMWCIEAHWDQEESSEPPCSCPECFLSFPSRPKLTRDSVLADSVRDAERSDPGREKRKRARGCTASLTSGGTLCWRHNKVLNVYCCTDEKIICEECASAEHRGHTFGLAAEERRRKQDELQNIKTKSKQILRKQEEKQKKMRKILKQIEEEARETEDYCEGVLAGVIDSMQRHYLSLKQRIRDQEEEAEAQAQSSLQTLELRIEEMRKREAELDRLAQTSSDVYFLQEWPSLQRLNEEDHVHLSLEVSEDPLLPFVSIKEAVKQLGRQLEALCDRDFVSIFQTADTGERQESGTETEDEDMHEREEVRNQQSYGPSEVNNTVTGRTVEPKTRAEFLPYACKLTLDPSTAHEDLLLSRDNKEVRLCPQKWKRPPFRSPEQFAHRRQVLCKEGLQAESCYYEIEVEGDKAEIALAYRGIDRKSRTRLSAFGGNVKSWSLDRSTNYSVSHNSDSVQLTASPSCQRIGVYLKFREGTLSFYEVSETMTFLYKIEAEFTEPLYPGFWLGEKGYIRICDLQETVQ